MAFFGIKKASLGLALAGLAWGLEAQNYAITKQQVGSGHESAGGSYALSGSLGQSVVGTTDGGGYEVAAGFWQGNTDLIFRDDYE